MSTQDFIKYLTETLIKKAESRAADLKSERGGIKRTKAPFLQALFGMVPASLYVMLKRIKVVMRAAKTSKKSLH